MLIYLKLIGNESAEPRSYPPTKNSIWQHVQGKKKINPIMPALNIQQEMRFIFFSSIYFPFSIYAYIR